MRKYFLSLGLFLTSISLVTATPPNIVLIVADDLAWSGLGCYGSTFYETPHIDSLARDGLTCTTAFAAAANGAPSRASLMTGQYTPRHGVLPVGGNDSPTTLPGSTLTLAEALKARGYRTAMFGKWQLGHNDQHPSKRGFDVAIESSGAHFNFKTDPELKHDPNEYLSDYLSDRAVDFIRGTTGDQAPFFLYYADLLVHQPFEAKEEYLAHFSQKEPSTNQKSPMAGAMIKALDDSVGKILQSLKAVGKDRNTLVLFTSDNGGLSYDEDGIGDENTSNLPLRGGKGSEYEGGIRVPWLVRWPDKVPAGTRSDSPVHHVDLFPTLLSAAEAELPDQTLDGIDLTTHFMNPSPRLETRSLFWFLPGDGTLHEPSTIIRIGDWKLIQRLNSKEHELYNTRFDLSETQDRKTDFRPMATDMRKLTEDWLEEIGTPEMAPNPELDPAAAR